MENSDFRPIFPLLDTSVPLFQCSFTLVFNVPETHVKACRTALRGAGAVGTQVTRNKPCWSKSRSDPFRSGHAFNSHFGLADQLVCVPEIRVETGYLTEDALQEAVKALKKVHPYQAPWYKVIKKNQGQGSTDLDSF